jgi:hypothetical protein
MSDNTTLGTEEIETHAAVMLHSPFDLGEGDLQLEGSGAKVTLLAVRAAFVLFAGVLRVCAFISERASRIHSLEDSVLSESGGSQGDRSARSWIECLPVGDGLEEMDEWLDSRFGGRELL